MRVVAALAAAIALATAALVPGAAPAGDDTLLALQSNPHQPTRTFLRVDARTLAPVGRGIEIPPTSGPWLRSPDGTEVAVGSGRSLILVDVVRMTSRRLTNLVAKGPLSVAAWPVANRLLARAGQRIFVVDPIAGRVVRSVVVGGSYALGVPTRNGIAYLVSPATQIGTARVVVVDKRGRVHTAVLKRIRAGATWKRVRGVPVATIRQPGFTVDPVRDVGYVVDPSGVVAAVDLQTFVTRYHTTAPARRLAHVTKQITGPMRAATWLGTGLIGITGLDMRSETATASTPVGVAVLDTRTWRQRMLEPGSAGFAHDGDAIVAWKGNGVTAFTTTNGALRFSLKMDRTVMAQAFHGRAYVWSDDRVAIVELATGNVLRTVSGLRLYLLPVN